MNWDRWKALAVALGVVLWTILALFWPALLRAAFAAETGYPQGRFPATRFEGRGVGTREAAPDATDRGHVVVVSPRVGAMGVSQAADAAAARPGLVSFIDAAGHRWCGVVSTTDAGADGLPWAWITSDVGPPHAVLHVPVADLVAGCAR